jgi:hypothetical protein
MTVLDGVNQHLCPADAFTNSWPSKCQDFALKWTITSLQILKYRHSYSPIIKRCVTSAAESRLFSDLRTGKFLQKGELREITLGHNFMLQTQ